MSSVSVTPTHAPMPPLNPHPIALCPSMRVLSVHPLAAWPPRGVMGREGVAVGDAGLACCCRPTDPSHHAALVSAANGGMPTGTLLSAVTRAVVSSGQSGTPLVCRKNGELLGPLLVCAWGRQLGANPLRPMPLLMGRTGGQAAAVGASTH